VPTDPPGDLRLAGPPPRGPGEKAEWDDGGWPKQTATVIDAATGKAVFVTPALRPGSARFAFTADGRQVAVASNGLLRAWDITTGDEIAVRTGLGEQTGQVRIREQFEVAPDGMVATWTDRMVLFVRPDGRKVAIPPRFGCSHVSVSPDGKRAVLSVGTTAQIWATDTATQMLNLELGEPAREAWFTADGTKVVAVSGRAGPAARIHVHVFDGTPWPAGPK
jgi:WD40 repeat protein